MQLLDGTRDRKALLEQLGKTVASGATPIYNDGKQVVEPEKAVELLATTLDKSLVGLARLGILVG